MLPQRLAQRVTQRAAQTTRLQVIRQPIRIQKRSASDLPKFEGAEDNAFNRERAAVKAHAKETTDLWRKLSIYATIPCLLLASLNAYNLWTEHWQHWEHELEEQPLADRPEYSYMNIRTKKFPWGDGEKTAFWNDEINYHKVEE